MRGVKGSGPAKAPGKGRGRKTQTLADIAARSANSQTASDGAKQTASNGSPAAAAAPGVGRGRGRKSSGTTTGKTTGRRSTKGASATNGQQRADTSGQTGGDGGSNGMQQPADTNGVKIETMVIPGRGGRPQQAEAFPFAALELSQKTDAGIVGPSFLIPEAANPDNVLAAARKRHKGKSFTARKMDGGVRIWRVG